MILLSVLHRNSSCSSGAGEPENIGSNTATTVADDFGIADLETQEFFRW